MLMKNKLDGAKRHQHYSIFIFIYSFRPVDMVSVTSYIGALSIYRSREIR
jgi:hypothetical protein